MRTLILIAVAFISLQAVAQGKRKADSKPGNNERMEMFKDLTPDEIATLQSKKMTLALDLSEKQQAQVKALFLEQAIERKAKMEEREKLMKDKDAKKPSKEERLKMQNARLDAQIEMKKKMKSILTADQYEKWEKTQGRRMKDNKGEQKKRLRKRN